MKERLQLAGYTEGSIEDYVRALGEIWDDDYEIVQAGNRVVNLEYFDSHNKKWVSCNPQDHRHVIGGAIHRRLKPGLEKVKVIS